MEAYRNILKYVCMCVWGEEANMCATNTVSNMPMHACSQAIPTSIFNHLQCAVLRRSIPGVETMNGIDRLSCKCSDIQPLDGHYKKDHQNSSSDTTPCLSSICLPDGTAHDQAFSFRSFTLKSKLVVRMAWERGYCPCTTCTYFSP